MKYYILASDGNEYGPADFDQIRTWISEGRANADTQVRKEDEQTRQRMGDMLEFSSLLTSSAPAEAPATASTPAVAGDYQLNIGSCFSRGWKLVTENLGSSIMATFLVGLAVLALQIPSFIGNFMSEAAVQSGSQAEVAAMMGTSALFGLVTMVLSMVFQGVLYAGLYYYFLKLVRGEKTDVMDAFAGFRKNFVQLILAGVVSSLAITVGMFLCILPGIYLAVSYMFAFALVIDKDMEFWPAMELSRKTITKHWFLFFFFSILIGAVSLLGALVCLVGLLFTIPICIAALMYAYEDIYANK